MKQEQMPGHELGRERGNPSGRRTDHRYLTVYRVALVRTAADAGLWRVKNMSDRGMLLESGAAVIPNEKLEIALSETIIVSGRVVWSGGEQCGIAFDKPVDAGDILRQLAAERESDGYRPLRLQVRVPANLLIETEEKKVIVTSLSQRGAGFAYEGELREAAQVSLALPDGIWRQGNIRWLRNGNAGLCLASAFAVSELESVRALVCPPSDHRSGSETTS